MAAKKPTRRDGTKASAKGESLATETTSREAPTEVEVSTKASPETSKRGRTAKRGRGRPRVSNTDTERVTLRVEKEHLDVIDTLVKLKQYSNRSDAIRTAIKEFSDAALEDVENMVEKQQKRQKLMRLAALSEQLDELSDQ